MTTHDREYQCNATGLVLERVLFSSVHGGALDTPVSDPGSVQPQDRGQGGA